MKKPRQQLRNHSTPSRHDLRAKVQWSCMEMRMSILVVQPRRALQNEPGPGGRMRLSLGRSP
jgi:hypothetical protein